MSVKIIQGDIPEHSTWHGLLLLMAGMPPGRVWQLGQSLARANNGVLLTAVIIPDQNPDTIAKAQAALGRIGAHIQEGTKVSPLIIQANDYTQGVLDLVKMASVDLLIAYADAPQWINPNKIPCAIAIVRGERAALDVDQEDLLLQHILVPTSGGPNSVHALAFLLPLATKMEITALYVAPTDLGRHEEALGRDRLRQVFNYLDAGERIKSKLITAPSVAAGIVQEASEACDLVIIGASLESSVDKVLFGDIPAAVVRESKKPVIIFRQSKSLLGELPGQISWRVRNLIPRLNLRERTDAYVRIRRGARPDLDFFVLIGLSAMIAALGLLVNSPAVVIGAMLVAPLMSPIIGAGLAVVLGDARFLRLSLAAVIRGVLLAIFVGFLAGLLHMNQPSTAEILARTQPTLLDLGIALFSGMAGAYALCRSDAAGALPGVAIAAALVPPLATVGISLAAGDFVHALGALLLFVTNFVAISSATAFIFLLLGFRPQKLTKGRRIVQVSSARIAVLLLVIVSLLLGLTTLRLAQASAQQARIYAVAEQKLMEVTGAKLDAIDIVAFDQGLLKLEIVARSPADIPYRQVANLQEDIGIQLSSEGILDKLELTLTVIRVTELDPLVPPTPTPTTAPTLTATPGPMPTTSPTATPSVTPTATPSATPTATPTVLPTGTPTAVPTATPTVTPMPTLPTAVINSPFGLNLRAEPNRNADILLFLEVNTTVVLLEGRVEADEVTWQQVVVNGIVGWVSSEFLQLP